MDPESPRWRQMFFFATLGTLCAGWFLQELIAPGVPLFGGLYDAWGIRLAALVGAIWLLVEVLHAFSRPARRRDYY